MTELYLIRCADDAVISLGRPQAEWMERNSHIVRGEKQHEWRTVGDLSADQVDALVFSQRELRHCDFCQQKAGGWIIPHDPVPLTTLGPTSGAKFRVVPFVCCDRCVKYVHANDRDGLTNRALDRLYEHAKKEGIAEGRLIASKEHASRVVKPQIEGVVDAMFDSMTGEPIYDA
jgi:hypothetical protein